MSFRTEKFLFTRFLPFFLLLGLLLRCVGLIYFPPGMEADEAVVVYWGRKWIEEGRWVLISFGELPAWEAPAAYFFGALDLVGIPPRWGAVFISFLEVGLCYGWVLRRYEHKTALLAATFLALLPWHFFFSYVLGPCVAGLWTCLYLWDFKNPLARLFVAGAGLLYYASFRVILLWGGSLNLWRRRGARLAADIAGGLAVIGVLFFMGDDQIKGFFSKGSYLLERGWWEVLHHYLNAFLLWWVPPLQSYWEGLSAYSMDDVGYGFANVLGFQSPLSLGTSLFFAWGLFKCFKSKVHLDICGLFIMALVLVGFSPSYVHFPFILPVVAFIAAVGATDFLQNNKRAILLIYLSLTISLTTLVFMLTGLKSRDQWRIFSGDSETISQLVRAEAGRNFIWTVGVDFTKARLVADRMGVPLTFFGTDQRSWLNRVHGLLSETKANWVFIQASTRPAHPRPEVHKLLQEAQEEYQKRLFIFENNFPVKNRKVLEREGTTLGVLYELGY